LASWERPVVTDYELGILLIDACRGTETAVELRLYEAVREQLRSFRLITSSKDFKPDSVFHLFGRANPSALEVACATDPFAYVTHLSAMEFHGISDRFSKILYLTTPAVKEWSEQALERMRKDVRIGLDAYRAARLPVLRFHRFERVEGMRVEWLRRSSRGAFKTIASPSIRVAMIGRTFLDMLREPDHCAGMQHVIDTYREYAARYLPLLVDEIDRHGTSIEKVRAGYLLEVACKLSHPLIEGWKSCAQRGGSRVLDPKGEYASIYSDVWKLSINVPSMVQQGFTDEAS
jgi:predicted transcriptional regulator of viral defense system